MSENTRLKISKKKKKIENNGRNIAALNKTIL